MTSAPATFHRPALAQKLASLVLEASPTSASPSGIFLAAPRGTGKSTFAREDLWPALAKAGALVIYVDLWADRNTDPSDLLAAAIRAEMSKHDHTIKKLANSIGVSGGRVGGLGFSVERIGLGKDVSLMQALAALSDESNSVIVLIIDEAQHAMTTQAGSDAMFALKAARDELNSSAHHGLRLVCIGSNRDKLSMLRNSKDQAFFGAPLIAFPHLGPDYVEWFCKSAHLGGTLDPATVASLFERAGYRPEILSAVADTLRFGFTVEGDIPARFEAAVRDQIEAAAADVMHVLHSLTPIQSAVLRVLATAGEDYRPFEAATMECYREVLACAGTNDDIEIEVSTVQQALVALQEKALVWKAPRGVYALEDSTLTDLLRERGLLLDSPHANASGH